MSMPTAGEDRPTRKRIIRHLLIFQAKLWLEGFKDVVLMPLSLVAALLDLIFRGGAMYGVMRMGKRFETWVHLYAALEGRSGKDGRSESLDSLLNDAADGIERRASNDGDGSGDRWSTF